MGRVEDRRGFTSDTQISLLESDMDQVTDDVRQIKQILWTLVVTFVISGGLFVADIALRTR